MSSTEGTRRATGSRSRVGWVVDVQNDFMEPTGRLYVHHLFDSSDAGAVRAAPKIERAVQWMHAHCDVVVFTGDWHGYGDREIDTHAPDPAHETYPPHCMGLSPNADEQRGAEIMASVAPHDAIVLPRGTTNADARSGARRAIADHRPVFVQKNEFSVFRGNPATDAFLDELLSQLPAPVEFVVCGVATDVCVRHAVEGFLDRGYRVTVVEDAMWGLGLLGPAQTLERWAERGAALAVVADLPETPGDSA